MVVLCCCASGVVALGQDAVFKDDFSSYAEGVLPSQAWEVIAGSGHWRIENKQLMAAAEDGLCQARKLPELDVLDYSARLVVNARTTSHDWATAGIAILLDGRNHWRLNLVEGPDKRRYTEFGETYEGKWQAQNEGTTRLRKGQGTVGLGTWHYGKQYLLRIRLSSQEVVGEVTEAEAGRVIAGYHYLWDAAEGVKFGRPGFSLNGFSMVVSSVALTTPRATPVAGGTPAVASGPAGQVALVKDLPGADRAGCGNARRRSAAGGVRCHAARVP